MVHRQWILESTRVPDLPCQLQQGAQRTTAHTTQYQVQPAILDLATLPLQTVQSPAIRSQPSITLVTVVHRADLPDSVIICSLMSPVLPDDTELLTPF
jgi:hypothetical protein